MNCTECKRRAPTTVRFGQLKQDGWFIYEKGCPVRFTGVVLCPRCRKKPTAKDGYGNSYPTAELEELASPLQQARASIRRARTT